MRIVFDRGFGQFMPGRPYEVPEAVAEIHVRLGRAHEAKEATPERKDAPEKLRPPRRR